jgi:hypothetical protein
MYRDCVPHSDIDSKRPGMESRNGHRGTDRRYWTVTVPVMFGCTSHQKV